MTNIQTNIQLIRRLWQQILPRRRMQLFALGGLTLLGTVAELFSLGLVLPFLGILIAPERIFECSWIQPLILLFKVVNPEQLLFLLTMFLILAAIVSGAIRVALLWVQTYLGNAIGSDLGLATYKRTLYQPYASYVKRNSSEIVAAIMTKINTIVNFIVIPLLTIISSMLIMLTIVVFMLSITQTVTIITILAFSLLYTIVAIFTKKKLAYNSQIVTTGQNNLSQVVQEGLGAMRDVILDGLQETYSKIYQQADTKLRRAFASITVISGIPRPVIEAFGLALLGLLGYMFTIQSEGIVIALPILGTIAVAVQRLLPLMQLSYAGWASIQGGMDSLRDVLTLLEQPILTASNKPLPVPIPFKSSISIDNLHFRYSQEGSWILQGINLEVHRGSRIGIIGSTGSGKSTFLDIIMGLLEPTLGIISIDNIAVSEINQRNWQAHIAHVPQMIFLADASIVENIALGVPLDKIDLARVKEVAKLAQISNAIESWAQGYDTVIGERGIRLSGGQRQRIGIARALYKHADVLVFDEATSALDNETEREVMQAIDSLDAKLTVIIVAHRTTTLHKCDQIVELSNGIVKRIGTYQEMFSNF